MFSNVGGFVFLINQSSANFINSKAPINVYSKLPPPFQRRTKKEITVGIIIKVNAEFYYDDI